MSCKDNFKPISSRKWEEFKDTILPGDIEPIIEEGMICTYCGDMKKHQWGGSYNGRGLIPVTDSLEGFIVTSEGFLSPGYGSEYDTIDFKFINPYKPGFICDTCITKEWKNKNLVSSKTHDLLYPSFCMICRSDIDEKMPWCFRKKDMVTFHLPPLMEKEEEEKKEEEKRKRERYLYLDSDKFSLSSFLINYHTKCFEKRYIGQIFPLKEIQYPLSLMYEAPKGYYFFNTLPRHDMIKDDTLKDKYEKVIKLKYNLNKDIINKMKSYS